MILSFTSISSSAIRKSVLGAVFREFNPLSPKSDQRQISPCNISALQNRVVMRIKDMITQDESN